MNGRSTSPPDPVAAIEAASAAREEEATRFLQDLVRIPTTQPPGDFDAAAGTIAGLVEELGFGVERVPVPEPFVRQHGLASVTNLIVRVAVGRGKGPVLALSAPLDTAPVGEGWRVDAFGGLVREGRMFGRGAAGSKADAACYLFALRSVLDAREASAGCSGTVEVHLTFDDETGGYLGPQFLLAQGLVRPDLVIAAGATDAVGIAQGGCLHLDVVVRGRQAHAARKEAGRDALAAAMPILSALYDEERRLATGSPGRWPELRPSLTVGKIVGGTAPNLVPDRVKFRIDRRLAPDEDGEAVERALAALVAEAGTVRSGLEVECQRRLLAEPVTDLALSSELPAVVAAEAEAVLGRPVPMVATPVLSGARLYSEAGIPTVTAGVGVHGATAEAGPHGPDEAVELVAFAASRQIIARCILRLLSA